MIDSNYKVIIDVINDTDNVIDADLFAPLEYACKTNDDGDLEIDGLKIKSGIEGKTYFDILMDFNLSPLESVFSDVIYMELISGREILLENELGIFFVDGYDQMEYYELNFILDPYEIPKRVSVIEKPIRFDMNTLLTIKSYAKSHLRFTIYFKC